MYSLQDELTCIEHEMRELEKRRVEVLRKIGKERSRPATRLTLVPKTDRREAMPKMPIEVQGERCWSGRARNGEGLRTFPSSRRSWTLLAAPEVPASKRKQMPHAHYYEVTKVKHMSSEKKLLEDAIAAAEARRRDAVEAGGAPHSNRPPSACNSKMLVRFFHLDQDTRESIPTVFD